MPFLSNSFYRPIIGCTVAIVSALTLSACQPEKQQTITLQGETMGTTYTVKYLSDGQDKLPAPAEIQKRIDDALKEVNRQMSTYQTDSEISQFNQLRTVNQAMPISQDFAYVTGEALRLNKLTHGALDVTVGPLVNLWGFGPQKEITHEPTAQEIQHASEMVGTDKLKLSQDGQQPTLAKTHPEVYLDLSSSPKDSAWIKPPPNLKNSISAIIWLKSAASCMAKAAMRKAILGVSASSNPISFKAAQPKSPFHWTINHWPHPATTAFSMSISQAVAFPISSTPKPNNPSATTSPPSA